MLCEAFETQFNSFAESTLKTETRTEVIEREVEAQQVNKYILQEAKKQLKHTAG